MKKTIGYAAQSVTTPLEPFSFKLRELRDNDVHIEILYSSVCHSDIHLATNEWNTTIYPIVPGHEIVGKVIHIGDKVTSFKIGDYVAPSGIIGSCGICHECKNGLEQYCQKGYLLICNSYDERTHHNNYGGFAKQIIVDAKYVLHIPDQFKKENFAAVAPLLCAGLTTYSPLKHWNIGKGHKVGVIGIGGLGHLAIKIAHALGAQVVAITTSSDKKEDALRLGASDVIISTNQDEMNRHARTLDFILDTIPVAHDLDKYLQLLGFEGVMCVVGRHKKSNGPIDPECLIVERNSLTGSCYGSRKELGEMLDFCAQHMILADVEIIPIQKINEAFQGVIDKKVRYRYVIDMTSLQKNY